MLLIIYLLSCLTIPCTLFSHNTDQAESNLISPDIFFPCNFEESVLRHGKSFPSYQFYTDPQKNYKYTSIFNRSFSRFKTLFDDFKTYITETDQAHKIPKIIHQIWLGSALPTKYHTLVQTWANWHGWEYKLWTEEEVRKLSLYNQHLYGFSKNYGEKSDILRLELLYMEGGLYVDTDFECLNPAFFNLLHENLDFYAGIEPLEHGGLKICNAIMASAPGHPLVYACITGLSENYRKNKKKTAIEKCGPNYITEVVSNYLKNPADMRDVFFPTSYLYPTCKAEVQAGQLYTFPESAAQHYWEGSWLTPIGGKLSISYH